MDMRALPRLAIGLAAGFALLGAAASPAVAQEYAIYLRSHADPVKASFYEEDPPWIFFRDDDSKYVFAIGCDRVVRVERGGAEIPPPPCSVARLPTTMRRVYGEIMAAEDKILADQLNAVRLQTISFNQAVAAISVATGVPIGEAEKAAAARARQQAVDGLDLLRKQLKETFFLTELTVRRVDTLVNMSNTYPKPQQRFFFSR